jgi:hypothetical protein
MVPSFGIDNRQKTGKIIWYTGGIGKYYQCWIRLGKRFRPVSEAQNTVSRSVS